jgi:hypothetical protein
MDNSATVQVTKVIFKAFDHTISETFVNKTDQYIHEALKESCETYRIISKEVGECTLKFSQIDALIKFQKND